MTTLNHFLKRWTFASLRAAGGAVFFATFAVGGARGQEVPEEPAQRYQAPTDPRELLKMDESMRHFFRERMRGRDQSSEQLRKLMDSIVQPDGLQFTYDIEGTFDARETFRQRRGNCVSFAFLAVAVARDFGYKASFRNVATTERWDRLGKLIVVTRHINVRVEAEGTAFIVDLWPTLGADADPRSAQVISDKRAFAEFYETAGFFELLHEFPAEALRYMSLATTIDPNFAGAWSNQASVHVRLGNLIEARACYERSLRADPRYVFAIDGYVDVLRRLGSPKDLQTAEKHERRAQAIRERNPYYQQRLAELAQDQGDWAAAEKHIRRAIALKNDEPEFYELRVQLLLKLGRDNDARRAGVKLDKLRRKLAALPIHAVR